jgi:hypothetical protein
MGLQRTCCSRVDYHDTGRRERSKGKTRENARFFAVSRREHRNLTLSAKKTARLRADAPFSRAA